MALFRKSEKKEAASQPKCYHPFDKCKALYEDQSNPSRRTGILCTACGERVNR